MKAYPVLTLATGGAVAAATFQATLNKLVADRISKAFAFGARDDVKKDIAPHLDATYKKCIRIKTLLNPQTQSDFLTIYSTQRFAIDDDEMDHYGLVDYIRDEPQNIILTGSGGSGKSMFMRYLWLSLFVESGGRIPIFIELRNLNAVSQFNMEAYLFHTLTRGKSKLPAADFRKGLEKGEFVVILDGFDEVSYQTRDRVQRAIMDLAEDYDRLTVIVSSRPDDRFASWTSFDVVEVSPLERSDTKELISKAEFEESDKSKFIKKIDEDKFYEQHKSFLSNPLLASMMLLTFTQNYDIPDKTHQFYESAFDALYKRHDSYKPGGFKREFLSKADEDEFKRIFAYFCLLSYYEQSFTFSQNKIDKYMAQALTLSASSVVQSDFLKDLIDAVCLVIKEGVDYTFSHRSFQEYFAAYCISFVTSKNFRNIVDTFSRRPNDQVVMMIRDMNPEQLRDLYVVPVGAGFAPALKRVATKPSVSAFFSASASDFVIRCRGSSKSRPPAVDIFLTQNGPLSDFVRLAIRLSGEPSFFGQKRVSGQQRDAKDTLAIYQALGLEHSQTLRIRVKGDNFVFGHHDPSQPTEVTWLKPSQSEKAAELFVNSRMHEFIGWQMKTAASYVAQETELSRQTTNAMQEIFGG